MTETEPGATRLSAADQLRRLRDTNRWGDPALTIGLALELLGERDGLAYDVADKQAAVESACRTVAEMHAAAVGEVRGPIRGVVGDVADLRAECDRLAAAVERTTERLRYYASAGVFAVNVHQVIALLSPTWPDGNYASPPQDGPQPTAGRDARHFSPGFEGEIPDHIGPAATCAFRECQTAHRRHEAAADIQALTAPLFDTTPEETR